MIADTDIDAAVTFLREGSKIANAKGDMIYREDMLKHIKAVAMAHSDEKSAASQERWAYASEAYVDGINAKREAVVAYEILRAKREAALAMIDAWRTQEASRRGADRA